MKREANISICLRTIFLGDVSISFKHNNIMKTGKRYQCAVIFHDSVIATCLTFVMLN